MVDKTDQRQKLIRQLSRGVVLTAPLMIAAAGYASVHAIVADVASDRGYVISAVGEAEGEAEAEGEGEGGQFN